VRLLWKAISFKSVAVRSSARSRQESLQSRFFRLSKPMSGPPPAHSTALSWSSTPYFPAAFFKRGTWWQGGFFRRKRAFNWLGVLSNLLCPARTYLPILPPLKFGRSLLATDRTLGACKRGFQSQDAGPRRRTVNCERSSESGIRRQSDRSSPGKIIKSRTFCDLHAIL